MTSTMSAPLTILKGPTFRDRLAQVCDGLPPVQELADMRYRNILLPHMVGGELHFALMGFLGQALRMRGANVVGLSCDAFLPACVCRKVDHHESACTRWCHTNAGPFAAALGLPQRWHSEFITEGEMQLCRDALPAVRPEQIEAFHFRGVHIGSLVPQSVESFFRVGRCDLDNPAMRAKAYEFLLSGMFLTLIAERVFDVYHVDKVVSDCGMQVEWGVFRLAAAQRGIPVDVINVGLRGSSIKLEIDRPGCTTKRVAGWDKWSEMPLTVAQEEALSSYLARRETVPYEFKGEQWQGRVTDLKEVRQAIRLPEVAGRVFAMFPNVGFDAGKTRTTAAFAYAGDWVVQTVAWFAARPDHHLIVKVHPGEHHRLARDPLIELLSSHFPRLPRNVHVILPSSDVTAHSVVKLADASLVYTSTVAAEAVALGRPVVLVGGGRHAGHGVTVDVTNPGEYFDVLEQVCNGRRRLESPGEMGRRYAYAVFFRADIPIQHFRMLDIDVAEVRINSLADLMPGRDACMDALCRGVLCDALVENPLQPDGLK